MTIKTINLVTGNPKKVEIAKNALGKFNIEVEQLAIDTPEIQSSSVEEVAKYSAKYAAEKTGKTVIKNDFGMVIEKLNGFPGPFVKFINKWLSVDQFVAIYSNLKEVDAYFVDALAYCEPGNDPVCFITKSYGTLTTTPGLDNGNMVDRIFIPKGYTKTLSEFSNEESIKYWSNNRFIQLAKYLNTI